VRDYIKIENIIDTLLRDVKPCSLAEIYEGFGAAVSTFYLLDTVPSTLKKETRWCIETFINTYQTT